MDQQPAAAVPVASFARLSEAALARERLAADGFAAHDITIVGRDLRLVDRAGWRRTGRWAAGAAAGGGWLGLLAGLLVALGGGTARLRAAPLLALAVLLGAGFGVVAGLVAALSSRRAPQTVAAGRYELWVGDAAAEPVRARLLRSGPDGVTVLTPPAEARRSGRPANDPRASADELLGLHT